MRWRPLERATARSMLAFCPARLSWKQLPTPNTAIAENVRSKQLIQLLLHYSYCYYNNAYNATTSTITVWGGEWGWVRGGAELLLLLLLARYRSVFFIPCTYLFCLPLSGLGWYIPGLSRPPTCTPPASIACGTVELFFNFLRRPFF